MNWKRAFWILAAVNAAILIFVAVWLFQPSPQVKRPMRPHVEGASFTVYSKKAHLNAVINDYLAEKMKDHPLQYDVWLADRVYVSSEIPIFGRDVELVVSFMPKVVKGGNVELAEPTISLDDWKLPVTYVLRYLQKHARCRMKWSLIRIGPASMWRSMIFDLATVIKWQRKKST